MKVKFLKPHPAFGYFPGQTGEVSDEKAQELIKDKFVEEYNESEEGSSEEDDDPEGGEGSPGEGDTGKKKAKK